jgi:lipopolysaccharide transport system permease protein
LILSLNPLAFILDAYRQVLMYDTAPDMAHLAAIGLGFAAVILFMVGLMRRGSQFLALRALTA